MLAWIRGVSGSKKKRSLRGQIDFPSFLYSLFILLARYSMIAFSMRNAREQQQQQQQSARRERELFLWSS